MSRAYFVMVAPRLGGLDVVLPLLGELKRISPDARIYFVFMESLVWQDLKRDAFMRGEVNRLANGVFRLCWNEPGLAGRLKSLLRLVPVLAVMLQSPGFILLHTRGGSSFVVRWLVRLAHAMKGRSYQHFKTLVPVIFKQLPTQKQGEGGADDGFLSFSQKDIPYLARCGWAKIYPVGYPRLYASWLKRVQDIAPGFLEKEIGIPVNPEKTVVLFLGSSVPGIWEFSETEEWIRDVVNVLVRTIPDVRILVKPHPMDKKERLLKVLEQGGYRHVYLTYLHVSLLAAQARFVVARHTSTIIDALAAGRQVIQYQKFTEQWLRYHPEKSIYPQLGSILVEDRTALEEAIQRVLALQFIPPDLAAVLGHVENVNILLEGA